MSSARTMPRAGVGMVIALAVSLVAGQIADAASNRAYSPNIDPTKFVDRVDNPYLPLILGARWVYEGDTDAGREQIVVEVTDQTKEILGVTSVVVHDQAFVDGQLVEDTFDWFAQDRAGNVWYMGEATQEFENGKPTTTKGSWEAGVKGAKPGIAMRAHPRPGQSYRMEYLKGEAEDEATILRVNARGSVPYGGFSDAVKTKDFTRLEPNLLEHKFYAAGIGLVLEETLKGGSGRIELIEYTPPGGG